MHLASCFEEPTRPTIVTVFALPGGRSGRRVADTRRLIARN